MTTKGKDANLGDLIKIKTAKEDIGGIMLESHDAGIVLIKLDSGYNIGISRDNILDINVVKKAEKIENKPEKELKMSHKKPIIDIIITGGTISSSLDSKTGGVKFLTTPEKLFQFYPEIFELADIRIINPFMKWSENMSGEDWIRIARCVKKSLEEENVKGIIVTHGTDFLHYTASALSFFFPKPNKPIVLTYSQRSSDRGSSDATLNLYCSAKMALSDVSEVMLVGHANSSDEFCYALSGTKVRKMHSSRRDAFKPINSSPIAKVYRDKIEILNSYNKRGKSSEKFNSDNLVFEDKIVMVKFYPGQDPEILNYYQKEGYKGIIIEMSGLGHVLTEGTRNWIPVLENVIKKGMIVCATTQTIYGRLDPLVYEAGRKLEKTGVIYLKDMLSETAFVKLGWVLGKLANNEIKKEDVKDFMLKNISKEFNDRLGEEFI